MGRHRFSELHSIGCHGEGHRKSRTLAKSALYGYLAPVGLHNLLGDGQTKADATEAALGLVALLLEGLCGKDIVKTKVK